MSSDKLESLVEVWGARYDDRDADDLVCERWVHRMQLRDLALAQPIKNFEMPPELTGQEPPGEAGEASQGPIT